MTARPLTIAASLAVAGILAASGSAGATAKIKCPIKASASSSPVEWAFTESAAPSGPHKGIASSYTHGRGLWQRGKASGTVCHADHLSGGKGSRNLVLAMSGSSKLSPRVTRGGLLGVELALKVKVSASDDNACPVGTIGTVTLFASYFETHRDTLALNFSGSCSDHDHRYSGSSLHVLITRKGAQVNSA
ncbi:MAG TPA: hypothetical protein VFR48_07640 [Solirubrobacteraceae bacterium]|nr:hypothetical protein [Solirubrobacteraceae bacterium]